ncbi:M28 family peptidase [Amycolatopsis sp. ATCC 39116]|uniref:M28 family peptidase n=1 Tax=Amycolatopsis sp. (strain ATCC 39116 / 75iv2) TaxID=385957 RepID=UPI0002628170|nr:M28 family peptidase [Amycolatopsis sp. ATCC 39116]
MYVAYTRHVDRTSAAAGQAGRVKLDVSVARLTADVAALAAEPRGSVHAPAAMDRARRYVEDELRAAGWSVRRDPFTVRWRFGVSDRPGTRAMPLKVRLHRRLSGTNLIARLPGATGPALVVAAHLDTVQGSPGADDNASGVAAALEVARLVRAADEHAPVTLVFPDMEELGLIGAKVAARRLTGLRAVVCLESVGYYSDVPGSQRLPGGMALAFPTAAGEVRSRGLRGDFAAVIHRRSSAALARAWQTAAAAHGLRSVPLRDPRPDGPAGVALGVLVPVLNHLGRSDHAAFWNRSVPSLMVTDTANFRNAHYHRATDRPDTVDYARLAAVAAATARICLEERRTT